MHDFLITRKMKRNGQFLKDPVCLTEVVTTLFSEILYMYIIMLTKQYVCYIHYTMIFIHLDMLILTALNI
jgi:hypothetical protein